MAFSTSASRFALLNDDASDPFEKKKKKPASSTNTGGNKSSKNQNKNSVASQQQGKKKKEQNAKTLESREEYPELTRSRTTSATATHEAGSTNAVGTGNNGPVENTAEGGKKKSKKGKKAAAEKPKEQWEQWQKRDQEYVLGSFQSDLEAALIQSAMESQSETAGSNKPRKNKNKSIPIPMNEFNQIIASGNTLPPGFEDKKKNRFLNGISMIPPPGLLPQAELPTSTDADAELMEQFRLEAQAQMERERRLEIERAILQSRSPIANPPNKLNGIQKKPVFPFGEIAMPLKDIPNCTNIEHSNLLNLLLEKDNQIAQLTNEKDDTEKELANLKARFKKVCAMLGDANTKEKACLLRDLDNITQVNSELTEQVVNLNTELQQEKSKNAAKTDQQFTRKRTTSSHADGSR